MDRRNLRNHNTKGTWEAARGPRERKPRRCLPQKPWPWGFSRKSQSPATTTSSLKPPGGSGAARTPPTRPSPPRTTGPGRRGVRAGPGSRRPGVNPDFRPLGCEGAWDGRGHLVSVAGGKDGACCGAKTHKRPTRRCTDPCPRPGPWQPVTPVSRPRGGHTSPRGARRDRGVLALCVMPCPKGPSGWVTA